MEYETVGPVNPDPLVERLICGCWIVWLAQGKMILPCKDHEGKILKIIKEEK